MGLGVPAMTRVFHRLRAMGVDIDPSVYTTEQARDASWPSWPVPVSRSSLLPAKGGRCKWH